MLSRRAAITAQSLRVDEDIWKSINQQPPRNLQLAIATEELDLEMQREFDRRRRLFSAIVSEAGARELRDEEARELISEAERMVYRYYEENSAGCELWRPRIFTPGMVFDSFGKPVDSGIAILIKARPVQNHPYFVPAVVSTEYDPEGKQIAIKEQRS